MRIVVIGDVGVVDEMLHVGDEAMFEQLAHQLRERGAEITAVSSNPAETSARYGVDAIDRSGDLAEVVRAADGVAIAGGGNIASNWPQHIRLRATLGSLAQRFDKPFVITGQTFGPWLTEADAAEVSTMLRSARLVGVREPASHELALRLGVDPATLQATVDDASFLARDAAAPVSPPYCLVSLSTHTAGMPRAEFAARVAALLDHVASTTGLIVTFLAHFGSMRADVRAGDSVLHAEVAALMSQPTREVVPTTSAQAAAWARGAELVVTSRYHPAVFAVSAGVPTIGIHVDDYTRIKLSGALGNLGQSSVLAAADLDAGARLADAVWGDRHGIRSRGLARADEQFALSEVWWGRVAAALDL